MSRLCLILFGPPGSGKGTQAKLLRERVASGDPLGKALAGMMGTGGLVPDETVNRLVEDRIEQPDCAGGFILDGYPRTVDQAKLLDGLLAARGMRPKVVHLAVDYNVIIGRLSGRRQCPVCGALYGAGAKAPAVGGVCDRDGSKLVIRDDDREEVVRERLRAYARQTVPVLETLRNAGYLYWDVDAGQGAPEAIAGRIEALVHAGCGSGAA